VEEGIDSISLNPDAVVPTRIAIAAMEAELDRAASAGGLAPAPHG
jgi:pyruvate,water dikinase